jgi:hypothetical protein
MPQKRSPISENGLTNHQEVAPLHQKEATKEGKERKKEEVEG